MKSLSVNLKNCYGIRDLKATFDFPKNGNVILFYAPNGSMKTSFAKTFHDYSIGKESSDRVFPERNTIRKVIRDGNDALNPDDVLVSKSLEGSMDDFTRTSSLLVNPTLRDKYNSITEYLQDLTKRFLSALKNSSQTKKDIPTEISLTFTASENRFQYALTRIFPEVEDMTHNPFPDFPYDLVFDKPIVELLEQSNIKMALASYIDRFNKLIDNSQFFKRDGFTYYNAENTAKHLQKTGFFKAQHSINLRGESDKKVVKDSRELIKIVQAEQKQILADLDLAESFSEIEKELNKNIKNRTFFNYISSHPEIIPNLANLSQFKEDVWKSFFFENFEIFKILVEEASRVKKEKRNIEEIARNEKSEWQTIIETFNNRFTVPFIIRIENITDVKLGAENVPKLVFSFKEIEHGETKVKNRFNRDNLYDVLSTGERRAFHILNLMFEIKVREKNEEQCLLILDDIADSFDYKNKYAIIEYISELSSFENFNIIILTHNYDFFRIIKKRVVRNTCSCYVVEKQNGRLILTNPSWRDNIFVDDWKKNFHKCRRKRLASIPFIRNLIQYTKDTKDLDYKMLTSLLHIKEDTSCIKEDYLFDVFEKVFNEKVNKNGYWSKSILELIFEEAELCYNETKESILLEDKMILSIASRLKAELYMIKRIKDHGGCTIHKNDQTGKLLRDLKNFSSNEEAIATIESVNLMTSDNIHLNSFMYEPIIDMAIDDLKRVYSDINNLSA